MNISALGLSELKTRLEEGSLTSLGIVRACRAAFEADQKTELPLNGYIEFFADAEDAAQAADLARASGDRRPLLGLPFAVKDNISIKGRECSCGSRILSGYIAPFSATVVERLVSAGAIPLGRTNMDEFAMGSSTEYSCCGPARNPWNRALTPGGSSGGSAAVVAGGLAPFALGTETGGSVRLPASWCGLYGLKPTYGTLSRSGIVAFGSSLDQVGLIGKSSDDLGLALSVMAGKDARDFTSAETDFSCLASLEGLDLKGLRLALPRQFLEAEGLDGGTAALFDAACASFRASGAVIDIVSIPALEAAVACYYVIALAEGASNLSRFDGIRYGLRKDPGGSFDELYTATRSDGFGAEVKRRLIIGNYALSTHLSGASYKNALSVRARIEREAGLVFEKHDLILCPTSPGPAFALGSRIDDPLSMYLSDLFTSFANLARIPALSVPMGLTGEGLPVGMQLCGPRFGEAAVLRAAKAWELAR